MAPVSCLSPRFPTPFHPASGSQPGLGGSRRVRVSSDWSLAFLILAREFQVWSQHLPPQGSHSLPTCSATSFSAAAQTPQGLLQEERKEPEEKAPPPFLKAQASLEGAPVTAFPGGSKRRSISGGALVLWQSRCPGRGLSWLGAAFLGRVVRLPAM